MDVSGSKWSSGCESGWTLYLDESYVYQRENSYNVISVHDQRQNYRENSMNCEEDLSMVSDASSGPPHLYHEDHDEDEDGYGRTQHHPDKSMKKEKRSNKEKKQLSKKQYQYQHQHQHLDDTASSAAISCAKMYEDSPTNQTSFMGFPQNLSETHFQGNTAVNNQYGFWQSAHPYSGDPAEPSKLRGRRWQ